MRVFAAFLVGGILSLRVKQKLINVRRLCTLWRKLVRWLWSTVREFLSHHFWVFLHVVSVVSTVPVAEGGVIAPHNRIATNIKLITRRHTLRIAIKLAVVGL